MKRKKPSTSGRDLEVLGIHTMGLAMVAHFHPESRDLVRTINRAAIGCEGDLARFKKLMLEMLAEPVRR